MFQMRGAVSVASDAYSLHARHPGVHMVRADSAAAGEGQGAASQAASATAAAEAAAAAAEAQQQHLQQQQQHPKTSEEWVEALVQTMSQATDMADARTRAAQALQAFEQAVVSQVRNSPVTGFLQGFWDASVSWGHNRISVVQEDHGSWFTYE